MREGVRTTGPYSIGSMVHVIHISDDLQELNRWYEDVFGGIIFSCNETPNYLPQEKRWASFVQVSDACIETMAPEFPLDLATPMARFYNRAGRRLHSVSWAADDLDGLRAHLQDLDIPTQISDPAGSIRYFFISPRYTNGFVVEFLTDTTPGDPRARDEWSSLQRLWRNYPLGIETVSHMTVGAAELGPTVALWDRLFAPEHLGESHDEALNAKASWLQVGETVVEVAEPNDPSSPLGAHVDQLGGALYAITFKVSDLGRVESYLKDKGIGSTLVAPETLFATPEDCFNASYYFTTRSVP